MKRKYPPKKDTCKCGRLKYYGSKQCGTCIRSRKHTGQLSRLKSLKASNRIATNPSVGAK